MGRWDPLCIPYPRLGQGQGAGDRGPGSWIPPSPSLPSPLSSLPLSLLSLFSPLTALTSHPPIPTHIPHTLSLSAVPSEQSGTGLCIFALKHEGKEPSIYIILLSLGLWGKHLGQNWTDFRSSSPHPHPHPHTHTPPHRSLIRISGFIFIMPFSFCLHLSLSLSGQWIRTLYQKSVVRTRNRNQTRRDRSADASAAFIPHIWSGIDGSLPRHAHHTTPHQEQD